ncbi:MAG: aminotransferase class I/II-fold pyridoxal phosphate-dependent enzyme [Arhodomonas sp.]|nr:aminotransferase class I/II-fold pyridoxal phosphate-dependent enzyme [Arhodomonas sp.]
MAALEALEGLAALADDRGIALMVDEIYHGLCYTGRMASAVVHAPKALVINSFSKYFGMTGWRLGWLVVPEGLETATERLIQNLYINASTPAQYAALSGFTPAAREIFEARREAFRERRDFLLPALRDSVSPSRVSPPGPSTSMPTSAPSPTTAKPWRGGYWSEPASRRPRAWTSSPRRRSSTCVSPYDRAGAP